MANILVIGGGIGGLCAAYFLNKAGISVTVVDKGQLDTSASIGNAGFLSIFEKSPFAYPGVFRDTARAFLHKRTPMVINSFFDTELLRWGYRFYQASKERRYRKTMAILEHFGESVFEFYEHLSAVEKVDCEYARNGVALVYTDIQTYQKKLASIPSGSSRYAVLTRDEIAASFPFIDADKVVGAIVLKRNGHLNPGRVISGLKELLVSRGVEFKLGVAVTGFSKDDSRIIAARTTEGDLKADEFVIASGAEVKLARELGTDLVLTPGKGYSLTFQLEESLKPKIPALFSDIYTAVTPRRDDMRVTGKIEFGPSQVDPKVRAEDLIRVLKSYTKPFEIKTTQVWSGYRPLTADDMPYLGRDARFRNAIYLTGLGHTGMNLGPISARIISEMIVKGEDNTKSAELLLLSGFYQS